MTGKRYAILVGNGEFPRHQKLPPLRCPPEDVKGLAQVLRDLTLGGFDAVYSHVNDTRQTVESRVNEVFNQVSFDDLVLFYYSGHGILNRAGHLHLATFDTAPDVLESSSVPIQFLRYYKEAGLARKVVFILDCCYGGKVGDAWVKKGGGVSEQVEYSLEGIGTYLLSSSNAIETSEEKDGQQYSVFTQPLIDGIRTGNADHLPYPDGYVDVDELFAYASAEVKKVAPQNPRRWVLDSHGRIAISRSPKPTGIPIPELTEFIFGPSTTWGENDFVTGLKDDIIDLLPTPVPLAGDLDTTLRITLPRVDMFFLQGEKSLIKCQRYDLPPNAMQVQALAVSRIEDYGKNRGKSWVILEDPSGFRLVTRASRHDGESYFPLSGKLHPAVFHLVTLYENAHFIYPGTAADYITIKIAELAGRVEQLNLIVGGCLSEFALSKPFNVHPGASQGQPPIVHPLPDNFMGSLPTPRERVEELFQSFRERAAHFLSQSLDSDNKWQQAMAVWNEATREDKPYCGVSLAEVRHDLLIAVCGRFAPSGSS